MPSTPNSATLNNPVAVGRFKGVSPITGDPLAIHTDNGQPPTTDISWAGNKIINLGTPVNGTDAANKAYVDGRTPTETDPLSIHKDGTTSPSADVSWAGHKLTHLGAPSDASDAANKAYVDANAGGSTVPPITHTSVTGAFTIDCSTGNSHILNLVGNVALTMTNFTLGQAYAVTFTQDSVGSRLVTFNAPIKFGNSGAPTLTTSIYLSDTIVFYALTANDLIGSVYQQGEYLSTSPVIPGFDSISGLQFFLDLTDTSKMVAQGGGTPGPNGNIASITEKSTSAYLGTAGTSAYPTLVPNALGSNTGVHFSNPSFFDFLTVADGGTFFKNSKVTTMVIVAIQDTYQGGAYQGQMFSSRDESGYSLSFAVANNSGGLTDSLNWASLNGEAPTFSAGPLGAGVPHVIVFTTLGTQMAVSNFGINLDGTTMALNTPGLQNSQSLNCRVGGGTTTNAADQSMFNGTLFYVAIYNKILSSAELATIQLFLATKGFP